MRTLLLVLAWAVVAVGDEPAKAPEFVGPRLAIITFTGPDCVQCEVMEQEVWRSAEFKRFRKQYEIVRYKITKAGSGEKEFRKWGVNIIPTNFVVRVDSTGKKMEVIGRVDGAVSLQIFTEYIEGVMK